MTTQQGRIEADALQILTILRSGAVTEAANWAKLFTQLDRIELDVNGPALDDTPTSVTFCIPRFTPLHGGPPLPGTVTFTDDHVAHVPVKWADDVGPVHAPADAGVMSADTTIATVAFNADMTDADITPVADGTTTVSLSGTGLNGPISDSITVIVGAPVPTSGTLDTADATFTPKV